MTKDSVIEDRVGVVHSFEPLGSFDGPGLRTVVFLSGCPMRCKYCHNPDMLQGGGEKMTARQVVEKCMRYRAYTKGGGVTLSGGEPLMQGEFTESLLELFRQKRVHTALDTAGSIYNERALSLASLVILDIKQTASQAFEELCSYPWDNTMRTLEYLKKKRKRFWVRQVIVPGITDGEDNVRRLKEMAKGAEKIELLPYHTMGVHKWEKLGIAYPLSGVKEPTKATMDRLNGIISGKE